MNLEKIELEIIPKESKEMIHDIKRLELAFDEIDELENNLPW